uniref:J domain-containing protein n=1 Tax=Glossina brevipalpis TaxID=37001 RepID=A0A1A9W699_9MUSC
MEEIVEIEHNTSKPFVSKNIEAIGEESRKLGNEQYAAKNYQSALKFYSDAIFLCPRSSAYYVNRAATYMMISNYNSALNDARSAIRLDPNFEKAYVYIVRCYVAKGNITGIERAIEKLQELNPQSNAVNHEKQILQKLRQLEETIQSNYDAKYYRIALHYLDSAIKLAPACSRYSLLKAECLAFLGRCNEAVDIAIRIIKFNKNSADAIYVRGLCFYYTDNLDKGNKYFAVALQLDPDHEKAKEMRNKCKTLKDMKERGNMLFKSGHYCDAHNIYTEALKIDTLNKEINSKLLFNRALVNSKLDNTYEAIVDCTYALEINPQYLKALLLRARCYNIMEKYEECVNDYEAAFQIEKTDEIKKLLLDAKSALKKSKRKDYYKILGVPKNANNDEIKKAYHKKALMHHPDRHNNSSADKRKDEELKFKEIGEAYAILSDVQKKLRYDNEQASEDQGQPDFAKNHRFRNYFQFSVDANIDSFHFKF